METAEIKNFLLNSIKICQNRGVKPTSKFWNTYLPVEKSTSRIEAGLIIDSYQHPDGAIWVCKDKEVCDVLECLLLVHQPKPKAKMFHQDYFEEILGVSRNWINCFYMGFDGWSKEANEIADLKAFNLGAEVKKILIDKVRI